MKEVLGVTNAHQRQKSLSDRQRLVSCHPSAQRKERMPGYVVDQIEFEDAQGFEQVERRQMSAVAKQVQLR